MKAEVEILNQFNLKKLSLIWDKKRLQEEVASIPSEMWLSHHEHNHEHLATAQNWFDLSLTSSTGSYRDDHSIRTAPIENCNLITDLCRKLPYIESIVNFFQPFTRCRLFKLSSNSIIEDHVDDNLIDYDLARIIIPIFSNKDCVTIMETKNRFTLNEGECWFLNDSKLHRIENNSQDDRVVLVIQSYGLKKIIKYIPPK